ncbi:hypothetical protein DPMN_164414 [Dreissena polymorpha]|uniref:Uncharacterized protein n=1 Tax=Dreissena polymorpha TaxID=45954 RepID=A0A9D4EV37_DREPO|nr:hypothetical protein DPMN_164414 [Dreissena polymorpha]
MIQFMNIMTNKCDHSSVNMASLYPYKANCPMHPLASTFFNNWNRNVTSGVIKRFYYSHTMKTAPPSLAALFFQQTRIIFELSPDIIRTNVLTKFHEDWG